MQAGKNLTTAAARETRAAVLARPARIDWTKDWAGFSGAGAGPWADAMTLRAGTPDARTDFLTAMRGRADGLITGLATLFLAARHWPDRRDVRVAIFYWHHSTRKYLILSSRYSEVLELYVLCYMIERGGMTYVLFASTTLA